MARCRNPECVNGLTPGLIVRGKGNPKVPVLGQTTTWGWVRCLSCNASEDAIKAGASYRHVARSKEEIAQRAELANSKAPYKAVESRLASIKSKQEGSAPQRDSAQDAKMEKLIEQIGKLTEQVSELLSENRELRKQLSAKPGVAA